MHCTILIHDRNLTGTDFRMTPLDGDEEEEDKEEDDDTALDEEEAEEEKEEAFRRLPSVFFDE